ncbi:MAG: cobalt ECF transporter T component CbiQ [Gammaproteobacteria bacterium]|nr:cobalt ECF transporter T component CbiQ [Gammaproteobacteria bacterium]
MGAGHAHALHVHGHSPVHRMAPEAKVVAVVAFVLAVALTPREALWVFALDAAALLAIARLAGVRYRFLFARMLVVLPFVLFALALPFVASGERTEVLGVSVAVEGLWGMATILSRSLLGVAASILLAATTEVPRILRGLERLRVPPVLTQIAAFMLRYLEVITGELGRMRRAMTARGYDPRWLWQARPIAASAGALFIRSYERGERVHAAMLARGWDGTMPDLVADRASAADWARAALLPALALTLAVTALLLQGA